MCNKRLWGEKKIQCQKFFIIKNINFFSMEIGAMLIFRKSV